MFCVFSCNVLGCNTAHECFQSFDEACAFVVSEHIIEECRCLSPIIEADDGITRTLKTWQRDLCDVHGTFARARDQRWTVFDDSAQQTWAFDAISNNFHILN